MIGSPILNRIALALLIALSAGFLYNFATRLYLREEVAELKGDLALQGSQLEQAQADLVQAGIVNEAQGRAISEVERLRAIDGTILQGLVQDLDASRSRDRVALNRIATLEKTNEQVRAYLNDVPPAAVSCVLDKTCNGQVHGNGNQSPIPERRPAGPVSGAGTGTKRNQR